VTWEPGRDKIRELLDSGELGQVPADEAVARRLLADASRHLDSATSVADAGDLAGAYQLAYDAFRKSAASLLVVQGLRATSRGGHLAVHDAVTAQFGASVRVFRSFSRIRRARNTFEYPDTDTAGPSAADVADAIDAATRARDAPQPPSSTTASSPRGSSWHRTLSPGATAALYPAEECRIHARPEDQHRTRERRSRRGTRHRPAGRCDRCSARDHGRRRDQARGHQAVRGQHRQGSPVPAGNPDTSAAEHPAHGRATTLSLEEFPAEV
jgi:hypothetical protein